jgi:hypothetical protein
MTTNLRQFLKHIPCPVSIAEKSLKLGQDQHYTYGLTWISRIREAKAGERRDISAHAEAFLR